MASPTSPTHSEPGQGRRRRSSVAHSIASASQSAVEFTEGLVLHRDPPPGFFAATAAATSRAPSVREIRTGSFGQDGWQTQTGGSGSPIARTVRPGSQRLSSGSRERPEIKRDSHGFVEPFAPLTEETTGPSTDIDRTPEKRQTTIGGRTYAAPDFPDRGPTPINVPESTPLSATNHDRITPLGQRIHTSGYIPPPKLPWTTSTIIGLKAFWHWFLTPFGFLLTLYGLNVVAWGGMLFLLLCNAAPAMCHAPIPTPENRKHMGDIASLKLPGPYYINCNDINSSRRIWLEIDCQIVNALFCVTGFGLAPWRFRDLYYLMRYRFTSEKKSGRQAKLYGLRVLAGIHKGWFRLPGSETLDSASTHDYLTRISKTNPSPVHHETDVEASLSPSQPENDPRIALPLSKNPPFPPTSVRAPSTKMWKLDFFIWSQVWNTFFQCCLCGFMWGMDRYARPPWSTGLFVALACLIAAAGGIVSFIEGKHVKRVEGVWPKEVENGQDVKTKDGYELSAVRTDGTGHESVHLGQKVKPQR